ncbi:MAG: membrane protein insertase YidC [Magnetospirillum sp.]|nr:membrane protein insertase YidC [Magnetospirillum sp.]
MNEQRNLIIAIAISALILFGFQWLYPRLPGHRPVSQQTTETPGAPTTPTAVPGQPPAPAAASAASPETRAEALDQSRRIPIRTPSLSGSIALTGARIDDLTLMGYHEEPNPDSPHITLLSPPGSPEPYYAEFGWVASEPGIKTPGPDAIWSPVHPDATLTTETPVALTWDNGAGLRFVRTYAVDDKFMFTVSQRVENYGTKPVDLYPYAFIARVGTPQTAGTYILHEGPLGVLDGTLKDVKYTTLRKERAISENTTGGWIGFTDKYWLTALIPDQNAQAVGRFTDQTTTGTDHYQVDMTATTPTAVPPGGSAETQYRMFAGAKILNLLDGYAAKYGIAKFDLAIDFGWFWFLTKPFFYLLRALHQALGNMGLAILAMTVLIKLAMFPLANKSYLAMSKMKKLQPEIQRLQERFADDKMRMQQEMMALYKQEKVNPASGCLPMVIQIPVFFALYKVLFVTIEMRHAPFIGWIHDLSAPDPTTVFNLFGLLPFTPPAFLHLGIWPLIMGVTMWLQQKLNPQPADPVQAKMFQFLPIVFTFLLGRFAAGLVIYWAWSNTLSILQQWVIMKRAGVKT